MKIAYYTGWTITRLVSKLVFRIRIYGREHIPNEGGFILASNHVSYYDPPLVGSWSTRQMYFLAKKELFKNPIFGNIIRRTNALPVKRGAIDREGLKLCVNVIKSGYGLVVFPEGTRSRTQDFLDPKPGVGLLAKTVSCPIVPAYVHGPNRLKEVFWGKDRMVIVYGPPIPQDWVASVAKGRDGYLTISAEVMKRIAALKAEFLDRGGV
jgi:1-acyl-sn-glycerol-3-phosphate acyltransferase